MQREINKAFLHTTVVQYSDVSGADKSLKKMFFFVLGGFGGVWFCVCMCICLLLFCFEKMPCQTWQVFVRGVI